MKPIFRNPTWPLTTALLLCALTLFFFSACRSTPISAPPITGIQEVEPSKTDIPLESAKLPETDADAAPKQNKEIIATLLLESLIGAPAKALASLRDDQ